MYPFLTVQLKNGNGTSIKYKNNSWNCFLAKSETFDSLKFATVKGTLKA